MPWSAYVSAESAHKQSSAARSSNGLESRESSTCVRRGSRPILTSFWQMILLDEASCLKMRRALPAAVATRTGALCWARCALCGREKLPDAAMPSHSAAHLLLSRSPSTKGASATGLALLRLWNSVYMYILRDKYYSIQEFISCVRLKISIFYICL